MQKIGLVNPAYRRAMHSFVPQFAKGLIRPLVITKGIMAASIAIGLLVLKDAVHLFIDGFHPFRKLFQSANHCFLASRKRSVFCCHREVIAQGKESI